MQRCAYFLAVGTRGARGSKRALSGVARALACSLALFAATPAKAFDSLDFSFVGGDAALQEKLRRTSLLHAARDDGLSDPFEVYTIARAEYGRLIGSFYEAGYFAPSISIRIDGREAADISPLAPPRQIDRVAVVLDPGPAFVFGRAQIGPLAAGTALPDTFAAGRTARSDVIREAAGIAVDGWRDMGHAKAAPTAQAISARHAASTLDVDVTIDPGPRLAFGQLVPQGNARTRNERVREIAGLPTGQVFSPQAVRRASERLRETGTFASVALREADSTNPDQTIDINATLVEAPLRRIGLGVEFDTESGGQVTGYWLHRNLLGGAERLRIEGLIGGINARRGGRDYQLRLDFSRPATLTPDTALTITALLETEQERDFTARRLRADIGFSHRFSETLQGSAGVGLMAERAVFGPTRNLREEYRLLLLPLSLTRDTRDDMRAAGSGTYANAKLTPFVALSGTSSGASATADLRAYHTVGAQDRLVLAGRAQLGVTVTGSLDRTPREFLFYSGGGGSVRGQPFRSLGVSPGGVASGGRGFAALSLEARTRVTEKVGLTAFADAGYISEGAFSGASDWHSGVGLGLRYDTEIGVLRLDVGVPAHGRTGNGVQVYLGIGQAF